MIGFFAAGCGSTNQVKQNQQETAKPDTTRQAEPKKKSTKENKERVAKLKKRYRQHLYDTHKIQANKIITLYILAQRLFYQEKYENALNIINKAVKIRANADLYALRGSIYLGLDDTKNFVKNWKKALKIDENVPLPRSEYIVKELQKSGLINKNSDKNF